MRVWQSGGEMDPTAFALTDFQTVSNATSSTTIVHAGLRSVRFNNVQGWVQSRSLGALPKAYGRAYVYPEVAPAATTLMVGFNNAAGQHYAYVALRPDLRMEVRINAGDTLLGGASGLTAGLNQMHCFEIYVDTAGLIQVKLNDMVWFWAGATFTTTGGLETLVSGPSTAAMTCCVDDMAVNSTTGTANTAWCGHGHGYMLVPAKDMFNLGWAAPFGTSSHYDAINDLPAGIDTNTYVQETAGVVGNTNAFFMGQMPVSGAVSAMQWGVRGGSTSTATLLGRLEFCDAQNRVSGLISTDLNFNINGWRTFYPVPIANDNSFGAERIWDGTGRMLSASSPFVSGHQQWIRRLTASANPLRVTAMWCNVEVAMPLTVAAHPSRWAPRSLTELETG